MKKVFKLRDLDCANCARQMEDAIRKIDGVEDVQVSFMTQKLTLTADEARFDEIVEKAVKAAAGGAGLRDRALEEAPGRTRRAEGGHSHEPKHRKMLVRILVSAALLIACALSPLEGIWRLLSFLAPYAVIGWDVL